MVFDSFAFCRVNKIPLSIIMKLNNHLPAFWQVIIDLFIIGIPGVVGLVWLMEEILVGK